MSDYEKHKAENMVIRIFFLQRLNHVVLNTIDRERLGRMIQTTIQGMYLNVSLELLFFFLLRKFNRILKNILTFKICLDSATLLKRIYENMRAMFSRRFDP